MSVSSSAGAGQRVREITARERLLLAVEDIIEDLNRFLGGGRATSVMEIPLGPSTRSRTTR
jgi:hypothetical protein